jgi:hypothetical protein
MCAFTATGIGDKYQVTVQAISAGALAGNVELASHLRPGQAYTRTGFARNGVAMYPIPTNDPTKPAFILAFKGSHGRNWKVVIVASRDLHLTRAQLVGAMTNLRNLAVW